MNSRNHHMWSSFGQALYEQFLGVEQPEVSSLTDNHTIGYEQIVFRPAQVLGLSHAEGQVTTARGAVALSWTRQGGVQCAKVSEHMMLALNCGADGGVIESIAFASFGRPLGACGAYGLDSTCHANKSMNVLSLLCVGNSACSVLAETDVFGDPCSGSVKWLVVQAVCSRHSSSLNVQVSVPVGSSSTVFVPLSALTSPLITEGSSNHPVWQNGKYVSGLPGVRQAWFDDGRGTTNMNVHSNLAAIAILIGSGDYSFSLTGQEANHVCQQGAEQQTLTFVCPVGTVITSVYFASFGTSPSSCFSTGSTASTPAYTISTCHAGTSVAVVERACLQLSSCSILVQDQIFGDPCFGQVKHAIVDVLCSTP